MLIARTSCISNSIPVLFKKHDIGRRTFYMWINMMFNRFDFKQWGIFRPLRRDEKRVKEIGPDRAAAEWIVRNGGSVRFAGYEKFFKDYNNLPTGPKSKKYLLEEINARGISLTDNGFEHLVGLEHLKVFDMNSCRYITDLSLLKEVSNSLEYLDISNCETLADISPVAGLLNLKKLILTRTLGRNREHAINELKTKLPKCEIID